MTTLRSQLIAVLATIKPTVDVAAVLERTDDFMLGLNMDSLDAVELTTHLSEDFGVEFGDDPDDLDGLVSLSALELLIERRRPAFAA
ncbi:MAG: phosphopantetheine-binding protein [Tetrasphaera sp.]